MNNLILIDISGSMREDEIIKKIKNLKDHINYSDIITFDRSIKSFSQNVNLSDFKFKIHYGQGGTDLTEVDNFLNQNKYDNKYIISDFEMNVWDFEVINKHNLIKISVI